MRIKNGVTSTKWYKVMNKKIKIASLCDGKKHPQLITAIIGIEKSLKLDISINIAHNIMQSYSDSNTVYLNHTTCDTPLLIHNILNINEKNESYENVEIEFVYNKIMQIVHDKVCKYKNGYMPPTVVILDGISKVISQYNELDKVEIIKKYNSFISKLTELSSTANMVFIQLIDYIAKSDLSTIKPLNVADIGIGHRIIYMSQIVLALDDITISNKIKHMIVAVRILKSRTIELKDRPELIFLMNPDIPCNIRNNKRIKMRLKLKDGVYYEKY